MRKTNKQKWDNLQSTLSILKSSYLNTVYPNESYPTCFYKATINSVEEIPVVGVTVECKNEYKCFGKITNKDLEKLEWFISNFDNIEKIIYFHYKHKLPTYSITGAETLNSIEKDKRLSFNKEELIDIQSELNEKFAPREGYTPCSYCRKQVPTSELVSYTIIFQNSKPDMFSRSGYRKFVDKKTNKYCSRQCGLHDQMAHEG
jgi:hypothetical protein